MGFITKNIKKLSVAVFLLILMICYFSFAKEPYTKTVFAFDTYMRLELYGKNAKQAANAAEKLITDAENRLSLYKEDSVIYRYNHASPGEKIKCDEDTAELIKRSIEISELTNGAFDITIQPLTELWNIKNADKPPKNEEILNTLPSVDYKKIVLQDGYLIKSDKTRLDLGAVAKGHLSDKLRTLMADYKIKRGILNLGGNVVVLGEKRFNKPYNIGIADPENANEAKTSVSVKDTNVITSGAYQRYFEYEGNRYHHIISPYNGYPAENGLASVTVINEDGTLCDGLSTAVFVLGEKDGTKLLNNLGISAVLIRDDGEIEVIGKSE